MLIEMLEVDFPIQQVLKLFPSGQTNSILIEIFNSNI